MERWFDIHLYLANWGTRRLMIRLPKRLVDRRLLDRFLGEIDCAKVRVAGENLILDIWLESKKRLPDYMEQEPANTELRSQYALRLYSWAKKYVEAETKSISLEELRKVLGLDSIKDADGNVIQEPPLPIWANFRQRAFDVAIMEINKKTDLRIKLSSIERSKHRRVVALTFAIKTLPVPKWRQTP